MSFQQKTKTGMSPRFLIALALALALILVPIAVAGCGDDAAEDGDEGTDESVVEGSGGDITIGYIAWDECIATSYLWKSILEDQGYNVELVQLDVAGTYAGLAAGDLDFFTDAWLPVTHSDYWAEFGDQLEDLTTHNTGGTLELTVPAYLTDINSIEDLAGNADMFGGEIIGIEPGAGLTRITREEVMPGYGLDDYTLVESSTPAMIAELKRTMQDEEPIVVTLWSPHWTYAAMDLKKLEDPQNLYGDNEEMHALGRGDVSADFPEVAEWLGNFTIDDDALADLANIVVNEDAGYGEGMEEEAIEAWLSDADNQALVDSWLGM